MEAGGESKRLNVIAGIDEFRAEEVTGINRSGPTERDYCLCAGGYRLTNDQECC
jgi:hypothetical protein